MWLSYTADFKWLYHMLSFLDIASLSFISVVYCEIMFGFFENGAHLN